MGILEADAYYPRRGQCTFLQIQTIGLTQWTAARKSGITKRVTVHTLRHSGVYPVISGTTHLLEKGYDIRTIQELLGHSNVQTTMIYTHVAAKNRLGVKSPLDDSGSEDT